MDIPETVGTGVFEGRWLAAALDNRDAGVTPNVGPVKSLRVRLTPTSAHVRVMFPEGPAMLWLRELYLETNQAGELVNPVTGSTSVAVVACDNPGAEFRWLVTVTADGMAPIHAQVNLTTGSVVDLADLSAWPVPLPEETAAWETALLSFQVMRDQVVAASDAITVALDGQNLGVVAGWAADTQTAKDQVLAAKASLDASIAGLDVPELEGIRDDIAGSVTANATHVTAAQTARAGAETAQAAAEDARDAALQAAGGDIIDDAATSTDFTWSSSRVDGLLGLKADVSHAHSVPDISGLGAALAAKADGAALAGKADTSHVHAVADVTGLQAVLDNKAGSVHSHEMSDVNGLANALGSKSDTGHTHTPAHITGFAQAVKDAFGFRMWAGLVNITVSGTAGGSESVTFPAGTFTGNPFVTATRASSLVANAIPYITGANKSGATIGLYNSGGAAITGTFPVYVIAVQML